MMTAAAVGQGVSLIDIDATFLPVAEMRQVSRVTQLEGAAIAGEMDLGEGHWVYAQHLPHDPIFPGSLMIEAAGQVVALWAWAGGQRGRPRLVRTSAEFHSPVGPGSPRLRLCAVVRHKRTLNFGAVAVWDGAIQVASVDVILAVLPQGA